MDKNLTEMTKSAIVSDAIDRREIYLKNYKNLSKIRISSIFIRLLIYPICGMLFWIFFQGKIINSISLILLVMLIDGAFANFINSRGILRKKAKEISRKNSPLLCFESKIFNIETRKEEFFDVNYRGWEMVNYIILDNDVQIEISKWDYERIEEEKLESVKIYFFEELLEPYPHYWIDFLDKYNRILYTIEKRN